MSRTSVLVIDAAPWPFLCEEMAAGRMPRLASITEQAVPTALRSHRSHRSELAWVTFLTGRSAGANDFHGWWTFDPATYDSFGAGAYIGPPWYSDGPTVLAMDLIQSTPWPDVAGTQVVAWGSHSPQFPRSSRPFGTLDAVERAIGQNTLKGNDHELGWHHPGHLRMLGDTAVGSLRQRVELATWMDEQTPDWDLALAAVSEFHSVAHHCWHGIDPDHPLHGVASSDEARRSMQVISSGIDDLIGAMADLAGPEGTLVLAALHGMEVAQDVNSNLILPELCLRAETGRRGFRTPDPEAWRSAGCPPLAPPSDDHWDRWMRRSFVATPADRRRARLAQLVPRSWQERVRRRRGHHRPPLGELRPPATRPEQRMDDPIRYTRHELLTAEPATWYRRCWPTMRYFALPSFEDGRVRVNVAGREAEGIVDPTDYRRVLDEVEALMRGLVDIRTGEPLALDVYREREDPFDPGPDSDLGVRWAAGTDGAEHPEHGVLGPFPWMRSSSHSEQGWVLARGPRATGVDRLERTADLPDFLRRVASAPA